MLVINHYQNCGSLPMGSDMDRNCNYYECYYVEED